MRKFYVSLSECVPSGYSAGTSAGWSVTAQGTRFVPSSKVSLAYMFRNLPAAVKSALNRVMDLHKALPELPALPVTQAWTLFQCKRDCPVNGRKCNF